VTDVHVVGGVLKKYLRSLPEPLLTFVMWDDFAAIVQVEEGRLPTPRRDPEKLAALKEV
jgi:hypothetical protein